MRKCLLNMICCLCTLCACAQASVLKFNNGQFKIMQITDLHWVESDSYKDKNDSTCFLIREMIRTEHPDIVVLTGDGVVSWNARKGWKRLADLFESENMPFAVAFGNHDEETDMNNAQILDYLKSFPHFLTYDAEKGLSGSGNCALPVLSSDGKSEKWVLYFFDSHNNTKDRTFGYYDWIKFDQIEWYRNTSDDYTARHGHHLPSLAFFHIPLPEYETTRWVCSEYGEKQEGVCAPSMNTGLYASFIEKRDVIGVFVGHDHNNDYLVDVDGNIVLAYGRKTGYPSAYNEVLGRGVRIICLHEDEASFDTYIRDLQGAKPSYTFEQKNHGSNIPCFAGSFIQEALVIKWDDARWEKEMLMLKEAGMRYLIYAPSLLVNEKGVASTNYPSKLVPKSRQNLTLERCLRSAQKYGIRIFVGLNFNDRWWKVDYDADWLYRQMEVGNQVADELLALYKASYPDAMYGWYWVWEVDNLNCVTPERQQALATAMNINLDHLSKVAPGMPLMLSPFMNYRVGDNFEACGKMWANVFAQTHFRVGDIFSPQDCVGAGGLNLDNEWEWFSNLKKAVNTKPGLKFWGNVETFDQRFWISAPLERVQRQLAIANGYVGNLICFAYSHYNSPYEVNNAYHRAYLHYCETGKLPDWGTPEEVKNVTVRKVSKGMSIQWDTTDEEVADGICIYRGGNLIRKIQRHHGRFPESYVDADGKIDDMYEVAVYNVIGAESVRVRAKRLD